MTFAQRWNRFARGVLKRFFEKLEKKLDPDFWADYFYRFTRRLENRRMRAFIQRTDFTKLDVSGYPVLYITTGTSRFQLLDMKFCREMLMFSVACLYHKKLPRVEVELCGGGFNIWDQYLEQPYASENARLADRGGWGFCCGTMRVLSFPKNPTQEDVELLSKLFRPPLFVLNERTRSYVEDEYEAIFVHRGNPRVCGVLCRGTDMLLAKGDSKQPEVSEVIEFVRGKMEELRCEYIYLATEEYRIEQQFEQAFPGKVLVNKREYYDEFWEKRSEIGDVARIAMIHGEREDDAYRRGLEYLSSIMLLSRCQALIAGACGGSCAALYINGGQYEYWHLFDLGRNKEGISYEEV